MSKNRPPFSIYETSPKISVLRQPKWSAFLVVGWVATKVEKAVRESDFALMAGWFRIIDNLSPHSEAGIPMAADIDESAVWNGMLEELSRQGDVLPKSLESVSGDVSKILWKPVSVFSEQKIAKMAKDAKRLAESADKEAKRAEKRRQNKLSKPSAEPSEGGIKKPMVVVAIENRLSKCAVSMKVYRYLDPTVKEGIPEPETHEVEKFISTIEKTTVEIALSSWQKALPVLRKLAELRALVIVAFPQARDHLRPIVDAAVKKASKPIRQAENRV